jgi:4'-phosphopantetheinyl transferase
MKPVIGLPAQALMWNALEQGAFHLWHLSPASISSDVLLRRGMAFLSPDEIARYRRYLVPTAAATFLAARVFLRSLLSYYGSVPPAAWRFETNEFGRPHVANLDAPRGLSFNLSHKPGCVACLVGAGRELGVDVEDSAAARSHFLEIASRFFSPSEAAELRGMPTVEGTKRFFELWTLKESYIKARGIGLSLGLSRFSFAVHGEYATVRFAEGFEDSAENWDFRLFRPDENHIIATSLRHAAAPVTVEVTDAIELVRRALRDSPAPGS